MDHELAKVSKALLDVARYGEKVLLRTRVATKGLDQGQQRLLERVDGFRSIEQLIAISSDVVDVHGTLARLIIQGAVTAEPSQSEPDEISATPTPVPAPAAAIREPAKAAPRAAGSAQVAPVVRPQVTSQPAPQPVPPSTKLVSAKTVVAPVAAAPKASTAGLSDVSDEVLNARRVLAAEAKILFGRGAVKLQPKIDACQNIEQIYDLVVRFKDHLATTGKGDPDVFLSRLSAGLSAARQQGQQA